MALFLFVLWCADVTVVCTLHTHRRASSARVMQHCRSDLHSGFCSPVSTSAFRSEGTLESYATTFYPKRLSPCPSRQPCAECRLQNANRSLHTERGERRAERCRMQEGCRLQNAECKSQPAHGEREELHSEHLSPPLTCTKPRTDMCTLHSTQTHQFQSGPAECKSQNANQICNAAYVENEGRRGRI